MCIICMRPIFPDVDFAGNERTKIRAKAVAIKAQLRRHEQEIEGARERGEEPCPQSLARLEEYREQMYGISQKI